MSRRASKLGAKATKLDYCPFLPKKRLIIIAADAERYFETDALRLANDFREKWEDKADLIIGWAKGLGKRSRYIGIDYAEIMKFAYKYRSAVSSNAARLAEHLQRALDSPRAPEKRHKWVEATIENFAREKLQHHEIDHYFACALAMEDERRRPPSFKKALDQVVSLINRLPIPTYQARNALELFAALEGNKDKALRQYSKGFDKLPLEHEDLSSFFDDANLTERQRQCASLKWEYNRSISEIARRLGLSRKTVDEHLARARHKMDNSGEQLRHRARQAARKPAE